MTQYYDPEGVVGDMSYIGPESLVANPKFHSVLTMPPRNVQKQASPGQPRQADDWKRDHSSKSQDFSDHVIHEVNKLQVLKGVPTYANPLPSSRSLDSSSSSNHTEKEVQKQNDFYSQSFEQDKQYVCKSCENKSQQK